MAFLKDVIKKPITGEWGKEGEKVLVLRTTNFTNAGVLDLSNIVKRDISDKKIAQKKLVKGDIIIEKSGGSPTQPVGRVVFFEEEGVFLCNNFTSILRPKKEIIEPKYLHYILYASHKFGVTELFQNKTTGIINLQLSRYIEKIPIPTPTLPTQQRIAEILDNAAALRDKTAQLLHEYDQLAQSMFLEMFGDPVTNPMGWEKSKIIDYCKCIVPGRDKPKSFTGDIPWVTTNDLKHLSKTFKSKENKGLSSAEISQVKAKIIPKESVILTCVGDLGVVTINGTEMVVNQQLHTFQCSKKINNIFLMFNISFQKPYMYRMASSTTVPYMNKTVANGIPTILPPANLQTQFADKIALIEKQKELAKQELKESEDLFNCLLQKAFKGELGN